MNKTRVENAAKTVSAPKNRLVILWAAIVIAIGVSASHWNRPQVDAPKSKTTRVAAEINGHKFQLEVADTPSSRLLGLGGRQGLDEGEGMLFVFDRSGTECFWMKDVGFSIDILWFDDNKKAIYLIPELSPATYPESFCPPSPAKYVVELPAGTARASSIGIGDVLTTDKY